jgi:DMSO/TMAO reductase YedYZ molybdopterin-dependent catalytic subunit
MEGNRIGAPRHPAVMTLDRRSFMARLARYGMAAAAAHGALRAAHAQAPAMPAEVPGSVPNATVLAGKDAVLRTLSERPLIASLSAEHHNFLVTPTRRLFIRNNLNTPQLDGAKHVLTVRGLVDHELQLTLDDLRAMNVWSQVAMLECAGAGRTAFRPVPRGTPWPETGGMGCPRWHGVSLADILNRAGVRSGAVHVAFFGLDRGPLPAIPPVVRSIPISKAMERHTMVVTGVNDHPLPPVHGFPMRSLVPGWAGSASIKWLSAIEVLPAPFKGTYMDDTYRIPANPVAPGEPMPADTLVTEDWPIKSMITWPGPGERVRRGRILEVEGRAWVGEGFVRRVDLSFDEGVSWQRAMLDRRGDKYAWRRFNIDHVPERPGFQTVLARATDDRGHTQPFVPAWNPLGYFWNGVHRVGFMVEV